MCSGHSGEVEACQGQEKTGLGTDPQARLNAPWPFTDEGAQYVIKRIRIHYPL